MGQGREASWADAVEAARVVAQVWGVELTVRAAELAPWHPGRCAELRVGGRVVGHAGELHPAVVRGAGSAQAHLRHGDRHGRPPAGRPPVRVPCLAVPARAVGRGTGRRLRRARRRRRRGAAVGRRQLLEDLRLFDVYTGEQLGEGKRSLAYALRFRAADRTLTVEEATAARDAAVEMAAQRCKATLRA